MSNIIERNAASISEAAAESLWSASVGRVSSADSGPAADKIRPVVNRCISDGAASQPSRTFRTGPYSPLAHLGVIRFLVCGLLGFAFAVPSNELGAQESTGIATPESLSELVAAPDSSTNPPANSGSFEPLPGIDFLSLLIKGGWFMVPIGLVSLMALTMALERLANLRRAKVLPQGLVLGLGKLAKESEMLDPRAAYRLCQQFPSPSANIIRTMLLKIGRPHAEIEHAVAQATQREADRLYLNVRWLNLTTGVAPLLGLLGTVWGLIRAFHDSTQLAVGQNRAEQLATGIYEALITTLAGLLVAIPTAIIAHHLEGKITALFRQIDELMFHLMVQVERFEGRVRFDPNERELKAKESASESKPELHRDDPVAAFRVPKPPSSTVHSVASKPRVSDVPNVPRK